MKKCFIRFLKEENVYDLYKRNLIEIGNNSMKRYLFYNKNLSEYYVYSNFIKGAFTWAYTYEGRTIWSDIHNKWLNKIQKINI